jgi:predicted dehydrogenase
MAEKVRWGILSTAGIAVKRVIPGMQKSERAEVWAIASRDRTKAEQAARALSIPLAYGSYEELIADPRVEAIYNPLPNHLHVPWSVKAAEAGKHVLCEKPLSLNADEARKLADVQQRTGVVMAEGFMVRGHPQWLRARELITSGSIGTLRSIHGVFSYFNTNPANIRNKTQYGGGSLMDVGCYTIHTSRFLFGEEPVRVLGLMDKGAEPGVDQLTSAMLEFPSGHSVLTCSMQMIYHQRMQLLGTRGRIEMVMPFTPSPDHDSYILVDDGRDVLGSGVVRESFAACNQFTVQADAFSRAVREGVSVPVPISDGIKNMMVIDAIGRSVKSGRWEAV